MGYIGLIVPAHALLQRPPIPRLLRYIIAAGSRILLADILNVVSLRLETKGMLAAGIRRGIPDDRHQLEMVAVALRDEFALGAEEAAVTRAERNPGQAGFRAQEGQKDEVPLRFLIERDGAVRKHRADGVLRRDRG